MQVYLQLLIYTYLFRFFCILVLLVTTQVEQLIPNHIIPFRRFGRTEAVTQNQEDDKTANNGVYNCHEQDYSKLGM